MKRAQDSTEQTFKSMRVDEIPRPYCYRFLAPMPLCSSLLGPKGKVIQDIQSETATFMKFSDRGDCYPNTNSRTGTVLGSTVESLGATIRTILGHVVECSNNLTPPGDPDIAIGENVVFAMIIPKPLKGAIIGPAGAQISELRKMSNTKIRIDDGVHSDSVVRIEGPAKGVCAVALWVNEKFDTIVQEPYFSVWAKGSQAKGEAAVFEGKVQVHCRQRPMYQYQPQPQLYHIDGISQERCARFPDHVGDIVNTVLHNVHGDANVHSMKVPIPMQFKGALIGKRGSVVREILHESMCTILNILEDDGDEEVCTVHIEGSIMACTAAYLLIMDKYVTYERYLLRRQSIPMEQ